LVVLAKIEISSPGDTAPVAKLAALVTLLMVGIGAVTANVTLTMVLPVAPVPAATVIEPLYVCPAFRFDGLAVTVRLNVPVFGVVPLVGVTESQPVLEVVTVKFAAPPPPETATVCVGGFEPPTEYVNPSVVGVADTTGKPAIANVTFTTTAVPPLGVIVKVAVYGVADAARPFGFAVTTRLYGVETVETALVVSQFGELVAVELVTVKLVAAVPEAVFTIFKVCVAGLLPPTV
jgi:hypothetical protein